MHLGVGILVILCTWKWGDWKHWQKYHTTMLYFALANLLYNFIYYNHWLWKLRPDFLYGQTIGEIIYSVLIFPLTSLIFLTEYPESIKGQILRNIKFITIYFILEVVFLRYGRIVYNYGWSIWWSLSWNCMMFPLLALHYKRPLIAYIVSVIAVVLMLVLFPVSLK